MARRALLPSVSRPVAVGTRRSHLTASPSVCPPQSEVAVSRRERDVSLRESDADRRENALTTVRAACASSRPEIVSHSCFIPAQFGVQPSVREMAGLCDAMAAAADRIVQCSAQQLLNGHGQRRRQLLRGLEAAQGRVAQAVETVQCQQRLRGFVSPDAMSELQQVAVQELTVGTA